MTETRECTHCKTVKLVSEFYTWGARCKSCLTDIQRDRRAAELEPDWRERLLRHWKRAS